MTSAISVSSGDSHSIATSDATTSTTCPAVSGTIDSRPCTSWRSVIARDTTCPVRSASCSRAVQPLHRARTPGAQVVLHVQRQPSAQVAAQEGGAEPQQRQPEEGDHDRPSVAVEPATAWSTASG